MKGKYVCSKCGKEMKKKKKNGFIFLDCGSKEGECMFRVPVYKKELTKNEKKFIKELNN